MTFSREPRERSQRSEDITAQSVSARSRLQDAKTERKSLLTQLGEADTVQETVPGWFGDCSTTWLFGLPLW